MCVVSMIGDYYGDYWKKKPWYPQIPPPSEEETMVTNIFQPVVAIPREEFDALKKEVMEMKELLKRAIRYDEINNQKDCHIDEKLDTLKKIAAMVGIDLDDILKKEGTKND